MTGQSSDTKEVAPPANSRAFGPFGATDVDVYVDDAAMREAVGYAFSAKDKLLLGVLAGELCRWQGRTYVTVRAFIPARKAISTPSACKFTREAWEDVKQIRLARYPQLRVVGWMQSLPGFGVVITQMSASLHQSYFDLPHQVMLTVDPVTDDVGFFGWKAGKLERTGFRAFTPANEAPKAPADDSAPSTRATAPPVDPIHSAPTMPMGGTPRGRSTATPVPRAGAGRTFADLLAEHGMSSLHRQLHVSEVLGQHSWTMDLEEGRITLGHQTFPVQVLGTAADADRTWLWAWANSASGVAEPALAASRVLQRLGAQHGIAELTEPLVPLDRLEPTALMLVATGVCSAAFSYRADYEGGAAFLLIPLPGLGPPPMDLVRAANVIAQFIAKHRVHHRDAVRHYFRFLGLTAEETPTRLTGRSPRGGVLTVELDAGARVAKVTATD